MIWHNLLTPRYLTNHQSENSFSRLNKKTHNYGWFSSLYTLVSWASRKDKRVSAVNFQRPPLRPPFPSWEKKSAEFFHPRSSILFGCVFAFSAVKFLPLRPHSPF